MCLGSLAIRYDIKASGCQRLPAFGVIPTSIEFTVHQYTNTKPEAPLLQADEH